MTEADVVVGAGTAWAPATPHLGYDHDPCLTSRTVQLRLRSRVPRLLPLARVTVDGVLTTPALVLSREWGQRLGRPA